MISFILLNIIPKNWTSFDEMIKSIFSFRKVKYNEKSWTLSSCNFWYWLKNNKCYHVNPVAALRMDIPIQHQPKESQASTSGPKGIESDDDSNDESIQENVSKRPRIDSCTQGQENFCEKCGVKMTKRRYWACPNKCGYIKEQILVINLKNKDNRLVSIYSQDSLSNYSLNLNSSLSLFIVPNEEPHDEPQVLIGRGNGNGRGAGAEHGEPQVLIGRGNGKGSGAGAEHGEPQVLIGRGNGKGSGAGAEHGEPQVLIGRGNGNGSGRDNGSGAAKEKQTKEFREVVIIAVKRNVFVGRRYLIVGKQ
ncbi:hypothetical protein BpHYR1_014531 [Brachionus plicatilis]|uniref:Uncharacterized protein n=1 Tax=Brachionus plicatilis TaxID=10195 RepID=A0A3M7PY84_BRAPC|nr:hypothetical protein BpHYR1_014531 [Brachionus plicatilis]